MTTLETIRIDRIDPNPHRNLTRFPLSEDNVTDLMHKMNEGGVLPATGGAAVRKRGGRYQMAYGHHRLEALKRNGKTAVDLIVAEISDEQMVKYLAMENKALKNSGFVAQYESWIAARDWLESSALNGAPSQPVDIARFLGWVRFEGTKERIDHLAQTCASFERLTQAAISSEADCLYWTNSQAREIVQAKIGQLNSVERKVKHYNMSDDEAEAERDKQQERVKLAAEKVRKKAEFDSKVGNSPTEYKRELAHAMDDIETHHPKLAIKAKRDAHYESVQKRVAGMPDFETAAQTLLANIKAAFNTDKIGTKLDDVVAAHPELYEHHFSELERIAVQLEAAGKRACAYAQELRKTPDRKVNLTLIEGEK